MPRSSTTLTLLLVVSCLVVTTAVRADELADIERLATQGDRAGALQLAERALVARPRDAQLRFAKGVLLADLQRPDEAMAVFTALSEDFPELPDPLNNLAVLHAAQGRLDAARVALESALRNDPQHRNARENLGDVYVRLAIRLWDSLAVGGAADAALARKLRLARELVRAPS
jgi:Flp pilus assembly protein TadD